MLGLFIDYILKSDRVILITKKAAELERPYRCTNFTTVIWIKSPVENYKTLS